AVSFQHQYQVMLPREGARDVEPVGLHCLDGDARQPRHLARMGRENEWTLAAVEQIGVPLECVQTICIDYHRGFGLVNRFVYELQGVLITPDPGANCHYVNGLYELFEPAALDRTQCNAACIGFRQWLGHQLGGETGDAVQHASGYGDGTQPATGAQCRHSSHSCGARLAERAAHDQHMAIHALITVGRPRSKQRGDVSWRGDLEVELGDNGLGWRTD